MTRLASEVVAHMDNEGSEQPGSIDAPGDRPTWEAPDAFPDRPPTGSYGYKQGRKLRRCSQLELVDVCSKDMIPPVRLVWTPDTPYLVPPHEVPFLFDALRSKTHGNSKLNLGVGLFLAVLLLPRLLSGGELPIKFFDAIIAVVCIVTGIVGLWRVRTLTRVDMAHEARQARFDAWVAMQRRGYTPVLAMVLVAVFVVQLFTGLVESVEAAGLVKPAVHSGQLWRLVTCAMLHGCIPHLYFNVIALVILGRQVETLTRGPMLAIVFLFSALIGSIFSLYLMPNATSVGASGGLLGLIGFLAVLGYRCRRILPPGFLRSMLISIVLIAAIGVMGYQFIDNAAHFGGLVGGACVGMAYINRGETALPIEPSRFAKVLGVVSMLIILTAALGSIRTML